MLMLVDETQTRAVTGVERCRMVRAAGTLGRRIVEVVTRVVAGPEPDRGHALAGAMAVRI